MATDRRAEVRWQGSLLEGSGTIVSTTTGAIGEQAVSWAARSTDETGGVTSPEELIAAAHAACYSMACSHALAEAGHPAEQVAVTAVCHFTPVEGGGFSLSRMDLDVHGRVPGIDQAAFEQYAEDGERGCPVSNALRGNVEITLTATLEG
jgi:lipoyl-dependent peroxiredoxin